MLLWKSNLSWALYTWILLPGNCGKAVPTGGEVSVPVFSQSSTRPSMSWNLCFRAEVTWDFTQVAKSGNLFVLDPYLSNCNVFHVFLSGRGDSLRYSKKITVPQHWKHDKKRSLAIKDSETCRKVPHLTNHLSQQQKSCREWGLILDKDLVHIHPFLAADLDNFVWDLSVPQGHVWAERSSFYFTKPWIITIVFKILPFPSASSFLLLDFYRLWILKLSYKISGSLNHCIRWLAANAKIKSPLECVLLVP